GGHGGGLAAGGGMDARHNRRPEKCADRPTTAYREDRAFLSADWHAAAAAPGGQEQPCPPYPSSYPSTRGSHRAISGKTATSSSARPMVATNSRAHPAVCSRRIFAASVVTSRFTATGGVNWPMAMFIAS